MPNLKHSVNIEKVLKNAIVLQVRKSKRSTTALYSETTKPTHFSDEIETIQKAKITKPAQLIESFRIWYNLGLKI